MKTRSAIVYTGIWLVIMILALVTCDQEVDAVDAFVPIPPTSTPTVTSTPTITPTSTVIPTITPTNTPTVTPPSTPTPSPTIDPPWPQVSHMDCSQILIVWNTGQISNSATIWVERPTYPSVISMTQITPTHNGPVTKWVFTPDFRGLTGVFTIITATINTDPPTNVNNIPYSTTLSCLPTGGLILDCPQVVYSGIPERFGASDTDVVGSATYQWNASGQEQRIVQAGNHDEEVFAWGKDWVGRYVLIQLMVSYGNPGGDLHVEQAECSVLVLPSYTVYLPLVVK